MKKTRKILIALLLVTLMLVVAIPTAFAQDDNSVAQIGETYYETLAEAIAAAQDGDTITVIADVSGETVTVNKNLTITGEATLHNVSIKIDGTTVELTVSNLKFTGSSYIDANNGAALTVTGVTADVDPTKITGRAAFIVLGTSEPTHGLKVVITDNVIQSAQSSTDFFSAAIFGWRYIADGSEISGNTFGADASEERYTFIAVKTMNAMDGAIITLSNNTIYGTSTSYAFLAFDIYQNCSRANAYTVKSGSNVIDATVGSSYPVIAFNLSGNTSFTDSTNVTLLDNGTTVNGNALTLKDIDASDAGSDYDKFYGVDVETNEAGEIIAGALGGNAEAIEGALAEGFELDENGDGTYGVVVDPTYGKVAKIGDTYYETLADAIAAAQAGDTITLLADVVLSEDVTLPANITLNGNGKSITGKTVWASGDLTFAGYTKISIFNAGYDKPTITIGVGATLETLDGRMVIGHGATFNIIGNITDAKTANNHSAIECFKRCALTKNRFHIHVAVFTREQYRSLVRGRF